MFPPVNGNVGGLQILDVGGVDDNRSHSINTQMV